MKPLVLGGHFHSPEKQGNKINFYLELPTWFCRRQKTRRKKNTYKAIQIAPMWLKWNSACNRPDLTGLKIKYYYWQATFAKDCTIVNQKGRLILFQFHSL